MTPFVAPAGMMADSRYTVAQVDIRSTLSSPAPTFAGVKLGAEAATRGIVVFAWMADVTTP
ncbi:MAG TPA: hypothetical protein PLC06_07760, partial [Promineifilum sp.]|nr:hypothetical protein [Promineifilum sp.]